MARFVMRRVLLSLWWIQAETSSGIEHFRYLLLNVSHHVGFKLQPIAPGMHLAEFILSETPDSR